MPLGPGSRLDAYELLQPLGAGGMGEVWLATEVRLGRKVALKFLPAELTSDPARVSRFEQEARTASALSHPNVCTILALGETLEGQHYIAMEYVEGETLRRSIASSRLTMRESLDIAIQIASALVAAHANGIVHRDIKPENVIVRPDDFVKVLDFGLAKLAAAVDSTAVEAAQTAFRTDAGMVVGTITYMSPEQARGHQVDARTDIWSLGCVLYEMVTGRAPFAASSSSDVVAAILDREPPPIARFNPEAPPELQRILTKALRKERTQRHQSSQDFFLDLQALRDEVQAQRRSGSSPAVQREESGRGAGSESVHAPASRPPRRRVAVAVAVVVLAIAAAGAIWWSRRSEAPAPASTSGVQRNLTRLTFGPGLQTDVTFSPDGRFIAYASDRLGNFDIWVQSVAGGEPVQITKSPAQDTQPSWSPDGSRVVFRSEREGGGIFVVPALGGIERQLSSFGSHPFWSIDGQEILFMDGTSPGEGDWPLRLHAVSTEGGASHEVLADFFGRGSWSWIALHPDGRFSALGHHDRLGFGFYTVMRDGTGIVESKQSADLPQRLNVAGNRRRFSWHPSGTALYVQTDSKNVYNLWKVHVDTGSLAWLSVERLTTGAGPDVAPALSLDGTRLAFTTERESARLWSFTLGPVPTRIGSGRPLTEEHAVATHAALSPDGRYVAYNLERAGVNHLEVWITSVLDGTSELVPTNAVVGCWSPDGKTIAYGYSRSDTVMAAGAVAVRTLDGQERLVGRWSSDYIFTPTHWHSDGTLLGTYQAPPVYGPAALALWPTTIPDAGTPERILIATPGLNFWQGKFSPNDRWLSFVVDRPDRPGTLDLVVAPREAPHPERWVRIAADHAWPDKPRWAPDGRTLYFLSRRASFFNLWAVRFDSERGTPTGEPFALTEFDSPRMFISPQVATTEIGVASQHVILTIKDVTGSIWMLDNVDQ